MKRHILIFLLLLCLFFTNSKAQIIINGTVTDSTGNYLQNVTVCVINTQTKSVNGYSITSLNGRYEIKISDIDNSLLRVTSIGFKTIEKTLLKNILVYNFKLYAGIYSLPEVVVKNQNLLTAKGDTLNYNVPQFIRTQDRTIGDVIKNLPGITVNATGAISYNGRLINKLYIDGDDILGDKYVIGTNTLPADVVTTVQVFENHQPIRMLENRAFSENAALNIKLKNSAKLRLFGSGNITTGIPFNSTDARLNTLSFKKKIKSINTYSYNSVGGDLSSEVQSQNTNSNWQQQTNNSTTPLLSFTKLSDPIIPYRYFTNNSTHLSSLNCLVPISKDKSIRFNLYWLPERSIYDTKTNNTFYIQNDTIKQFENQVSKLRSHNLFFNAIYLLNSKSKYIQNQVTLEANFRNGNSNVENERNIFVQNLKNRNTKFQNTFFFKKALRKEINLELTSNLKYYRSPDNLNIEYGIYPWLLNNNVNYNRTSQFLTQEMVSHTTEISLSKKVKHFITSIKGVHFAESANYTSWLNLLQTNNENKRGDSLFENKLIWFQQRLNLCPELDFKRKKLHISIAFPILIRSIKYHNKLTILDTTILRTSIHPTIRLNYELGNKSKLLLTIRRETDMTKPDNLLTGGVLSNYRILSQNLQSLQFNNVNSFALSYSYRNPIKIKFFNTALIYSRNFSPVISSQFFNLGIIQNGQQVYSNITQRQMLLTNYSKYIFPLKTTIKLSYNGTILNYFQVQNSLINNLQSISNSATLSLITKPKKYFNGELNINYITSASKNKSQKVSVGKPINTLNTNFVSTLSFNENTFLQFEANHIFQHTINDIKVLLLDVKLNHTLPKTKTDIGIKAINIFNQQRFVINNIDGLQVSTNDYWIRPFTILLTASFRF